MKTTYNRLNLSFMEEIIGAHATRYNLGNNNEFVKLWTQSEIC